ncbi:MAG: hypothetical protein MJA30_12660, partial [Cytophagales bacterium]|nr:hypothetical protein [Cytophagales bacterium]
EARVRSQLLKERVRSLGKTPMLRYIGPTAISFTAGKERFRSLLRDTRNQELRTRNLPYFCIMLLY